MRGGTVPPGVNAGAPIAFPSHGGLRMSDELRRDAELLSALLNDAALVRDRVDGQVARFVVKQLVVWTGKAEQTISEYRNGTRNIPVEFWRSILEHFCDRRIIALLIPEEFDFEISDVRCNCPASAPAFFRDAIEAEIAYHEQMKAVAQILADGRIDDFDAKTVREYDDAFHVHRKRDANLHHAIVNTFNRAVERKAVNP